MPFVKKLILVQNTVRNCPAAQNWGQNTLPNCPFASNKPVLLGSQRLWKGRAQLSCISKFAPNYTAQLLFSFKLARILRKLKLVRNSVRNSFLARNWRQNTLRNFCFAWKVKLHEKNRSHFPCCSKLVSKHSAQLSFRLQLASLIKQPDKIFSLFDL